VIERAEILVLSHPLSRTRLFSTGSNVTRDSIVVRLEDGDGQVGWGETYLVPGAVEAARMMTEPLPGQDPDDATAELVARPRSHRWALGAVTMALDDLRGRSRGVPVSSLYGRRLRDRVRPYASSRGYVEGRDAFDAWSEEAATTAAEGFHAMKLRIGRYDLAGEIEAIERVAAAFPAMTWMADGNGAYSLDESRRLGAALDALGFRWLEEPLPTDDYAAYAPLARELTIPLAGGEILESAAAAAPFLAAGSFDLIQPDVSICGGIGGVLEIGRAAADVGRFMVPHACSGAIAMAATLQILAILDVAPDAPSWAEPLLEFDVGENPIRTDLLTVPLAPSDGWMSIPDGPGLGVDVDEDAVRQLAVAA
jgi:D-galactarolactone cycloisomerase